MLQRQQHNFDRMDAQVDAIQKSRCPDTYDPPKAEDMGAVIINNGFIGHEEALQLLAKQAGSEPATDQQATPPSVQEPLPPPVQQPEQPGIQMPTTKKPLSNMAKAAMIAAGLGTATIGGALVNEYFDSDTPAIRYDVEAIPYQPINAE